MFLPGDLIFVSGDGAIAEAIRWATRRRGEAASYANHVAGFVTPGMVVEALWTVVDHPYAEALHGQAHQVWRCAALTDEQRCLVAGVAGMYVGRKYGVDKLLLQLDDALIAKITGRDVNFFRRLDESDTRPICSMLWACAYDHALGLRFGVDPDAANPDDMHDFVSASPVWEMVYEFKGGKA